MSDLIKVDYAQTGGSLTVDALGMREMQKRAYQERNKQHILIKAPPASGKSRALMFLGLDKLHNQGLKKVIIAVPERAIAKSFAPTDLTTYGFFKDWQISDGYDLCITGGEAGKIKLFKKFLDDSSADVLLCTHATLRFAFNELTPQHFDSSLLAIDEFHHVSADADNKLGDIIRSVIADSQAHKAKIFVEERGHKPQISSHDPKEKRMAEGVAYLQARWMEKKHAREAVSS